MKNKQTLEITVADKDRYEKLLILSNEIPYEEIDCIMHSTLNGKPAIITPPVDWAHSAARGIMYALHDVTIMGEDIADAIECAPEHVRTAIIKEISNIIRVAAQSQVDIKKI